jgi:hypothetical protein
MRFKRKLTHRLKRFGAWLKQVVLLGRADWHRASDDVNPPRLSRTEREQLRPPFDLNIIKPRAFAGPERVREEPAANGSLEASGPVALPPRPEAPSEFAAQPGRVRRRRRSNQTAVNPLSGVTPDKLPASKLAVFVEKFLGRRD